CFSCQNYPLFLKTLSTENELKSSYIVHTSLDVIEEKISSGGKNTNDPRELYQGLLYPTEDYKVYGYVTNTKIKFIGVLNANNITLRDNEIRSVIPQDREWHDGAGVVAHTAQLSDVTTRSVSQTETSAVKSSCVLLQSSQKDVIPTHSANITAGKYV
ncbi:hypothetical protein NP493_80g05023, partial [Ridgeia piscesae]